MLCVSLRDAKRFQFGFCHHNLSRDKTLCVKLALSNLTILVRLVLCVGCAIVRCVVQPLCFLTYDLLAVSCGCATVVGACQAQHCRLGWGVNSFAGAHSVAQAPGLSPKVELGGSVAKLLPPSIHPYHAQGLRPWPDSALWGQPVSPQ